ncbi:MAG: TonB-dependent receptor plug domain-containing protein, partial [Kordiimonadaceae bacterium]|nr:TonB-dependent receptor plug domain-containing protein [Kordiimonadaceae bacterium]
MKNASPRCYKPANLVPAISALIFAQVCAPTAIAADEELVLDEIIVTALRREQRLQDVPLSLTALSGDQMAALGIDDFQDFAARVPGFNIHGRSSVENSITLRGISPMGGSAAPVAVYIDDMPISGIQQNGQPSIKTFDVSRIEILRGPQGTLYGEGSLGGTIKVIMNKPDVTGFAAKVDATLSSTANGGTNGAVNLMVNLPLVEDKIAMRGILQYRDTSGFIDAPNLGLENVNREQLLNGRVSLRMLASDKLTFDMTAIFQDIDLDGRNSSYINTATDPAGTVAGTYDERETSISLIEPGTANFTQYNFTATYNAENYQIVASTSYYDRDTEINRDLAGLLPAANSIFQTNLGGGFNPFLTTITSVDGVGNLRESDEKIFTQEVRFSYDGIEGVNIQLGVFYKDRENFISDRGFSTPDVTSFIRPVVDLGAGGAIGSYVQDIDAVSYTHLTLPT